MSVKDYGPVTAYAYVVEHDLFTGTMEEWINQLLSIAESANSVTSGAQNAANSATAAAGSATAAAGSATAAAGSATDAAGYATAASGSANDAEASASNAANSATAAASSAALADDKLTAMEGSLAQAVSDAESAAAGSANDAEAWAIGKRSGVDVGLLDPTYHNNSKYYSDQLTAVAQDLADEIDKKSSEIRVTASDFMAHFKDAADAPVSIDITINPIQEGSGDPSPSNVRAISGWPAVKLACSKENLINVTSVSVTSNSGITAAINPDGSSITINGTATRNGSVTTYFNGDNRTKFWPNGTYYNTGEARILLRKTDTGGQSRWINIGSSFTITGTDCPGSAYLTFSTGDTFDNQVIKYQITAENTSKYYPQHVEDIVISLPQEAGTVYGGTLHINQDGSGVLTVDRAITTVNDKTWTYNATYLRFAATFSDVKVYSGNRTMPLVSSMFTCLTGRDVAADDDYVIYNGGNNTTIYVRDKNHTTQTAFKEACGNATIVYPLANPTSYPLTAVQISSLFGENNIWADTGPVSVNYRADTKLYIQSLAGQPDEDMMADAAINDNTYFMVGNRLFLSTEAIAVGEHIAPGGNCTETNLAEALNAINA